MLHKYSHFPAALLTILFLVFFLFQENSFALINADEKVGDETCATCHDEAAEAFTANIHTQKAVEKGFICESCHGPGGKHAEEGDPELIYNPGTGFNAAKGTTCISCHNGSEFESMTGKTHWEQANGCSDCHTVHQTKAKLLKKTGSDLCIQCHRDVQSQFRLTSHHPVPEGLMECESCHQVHGDANKFATTNESRELCLSCHSSKEGPFVYEHQPVNEDCNICHKPHGAVANNLLVQSEPALCMSCHPMHFHTSLTGLNGTFSDPLVAGRGGLSTTDGMKKAFNTKCTQCHTHVHGSDLPSQGVSSQGKSLTR